MHLELRRDVMAQVDFTGSLFALLCLATALTLSVAAEPDGTFSLLGGNRRHLESSSPSTIEHPLGDIVADQKVSKKIASTLVMAEGGPISVSTTTQHANNETAIGSDILDGSKTRENVPKERNAAPSVVARKGVEEKKVKPRKGVSQNLDLVDTTTFSQTIFKDIKPVVESISATETVYASAHSQSELFSVSTLNLNAISPHINSSLEHGANSSLNLVPLNTTTLNRKATNNTTILKSSHVEKHIPKPKPTVTTVGKIEVNEFRPPPRTKISPLGVPSKIDYVVPVIITVIALPLLGAAIVVLYRHGRDCWDKRHYRRMDFLIDGMYND